MARILWALLLLSACVEASITAAWKIPVEHFAPDYKTNAKVRKLEKPPGKSGFLKAGDELWDVSKVLWSADLKAQDPFEEPEAQTKRPWGGEWAVWNSRSGMLVARGGYFEILEAQSACGFDDLPRLSLARFKLKQGSGETVLPILSRSGERTQTRANGVEIDLDLVRGRKSFHDLRCSASWKAPGTDANWHVTSTFSTWNDREVLVGRCGSGDAGWELRATVSCKSVGGVPVADARWIEIGAKAPQAWGEANVGQPLFERQPLGVGLSIAVYQAPPPVGSGNPPADLEAPERLRGWIRGSFHDVGKALEAEGIDSKAPGFFAGVETRTGQLVLVGNDVAHDSVAKRIRSAVASAPPSILAETDERSGNWALLCGSDLKAAVTLTKRDKDEDRTVKTFEVHPTLKEEAAVALVYRGNFDANAGEPSEVTITLKPGDWQELEATAAGNKPKLRVTLNPP